MTGGMEITILLVLLIAKLTRADMFYNMLNREDPCISLCEKTPTSFSNNKYVKSCCQRGCRFFNLVDLRYGWESNNFNGTRDACEASCTEAYNNLQDRYACGTGCDFMAKQRISYLLSLFSITICVEEKIDTNVLLMSPDMPENDILTDPGLRKELLPRWWDSDGFKLPQTYIKTVPMDTGTVDYALSSDYSGETEQAASTPGSDCYHCILKLITIWDVGISFWFSASFIMIFVMLSTWIICQLICQQEDVPTTSHKDVLIDTSISSENMLYISNEALLYKEPPPKYDQSLNRSEF